MSEAFYILYLVFCYGFSFFEWWASNGGGSFDEFVTGIFIHMDENASIYAIREL